MLGFLRFIFLFSFLYITLDLSAQEPPVVVRSTDTVIENGSKYYLHKVQRGETLYAISKAYKVKVEDIAASNKDVLKGINVGQVIKIPATGEINFTKLTDYEGVNSYVHEVKLGETLYSISRKYMVTPDDIKAHNKGLTNMITVGQKIYIPTVAKKTDTKVTKKPEEPKVESVKSTNKVMLNGKTYLLHKVVKGETLYRIKTLYEIPVEVLIRENPELANGLKAGQNIKIPVDVKEFKQKEYIYHSVAKGETLYSLSKKYNVTVQELLALNSELKEGLKAGVTIKIPINNDNITTAEEHLSEKYIYHEVKKGETFYFITKKYGVSKKDLKKENKGLSPKDLQIGTIVKVPVKNSKVYEYIPVDSLQAIDGEAVPRFIDTMVALCCDSLPIDDSKVLHIALFQPFYLTANDTIDLSENIVRRKERIYTPSKSFVEFYEGILIALEELKRDNYKIQLDVYDTERDTNVVKSTLAKLHPEELDLIIGPVYENSLEIVAKYAGKYNLPVVSPLSAKSECIEDYPNLIMVNTPEEFRIEAMSLYSSQYSDCNFVFIFNAHIEEYDLIQRYKDLVKRTDTIAYKNVAFKEINYPETGIEEVETSLSADKKNLIIIPSHDQAFVNDIITKLYLYVKDYDLTVYGLAVWEHYQNIELDYLFDLHFNFATSSYIDYNNADVVTFIKTYRSQFKSEPSLFAYRGYDIMKYFAPAIRNYGNFLEACIVSKPYKGLQTEYRFERIAPGGGLVNKGTFLVNYTSEYKRELIDYNIEEARQKLYERINMEMEASGDIIKTDNWEDKTTAPQAR